MVIKQYDVVIVQLDPTIGSEIKKTRPCLVISPDEMNRPLRTVIVAPMTSTQRKYPSRVPVTFQGKTGDVALDQLRTVDKARIIKVAGKITKSDISGVKETLYEMLVA